MNADTISQARTALVHLDRLMKTLAGEDFELSVEEAIATADTIGSATLRLRDVLAELEAHDCHDNVPNVQPLDDCNYALILYRGGVLDWEQAQVAGFTKTRELAEIWRRGQASSVARFIPVSELAGVTS